VPLHPNSPSTHAGEKIPQATASIDKSRQSDTREANPDYYHREQKKRVCRLHGLTSDELWSNHYQKAAICIFSNNRCCGATQSLHNTYCLRWKSGNTGECTAFARIAAFPPQT